MLSDDYEDLGCTSLSFCKNVFEWFNDNKNTQKMCISIFVCMSNICVHSIHNIDFPHKTSFPRQYNPLLKEVDHLI